jgi:hypothetical protein
MFPIMFLINRKVSENPAKWGAIARCGLSSLGWCRPPDRFDSVEPSPLGDSIAASEAMLWARSSGGDPAGSLVPGPSTGFGKLRVST